jgi:hypothetical protein
MRAPLFLGGGFASPLLHWARGGRGEAALHLDRRGGEPSGPCLLTPPPPKELNASQMQPALECNQVFVGASCKTQTAVEASQKRAGSGKGFAVRETGKLSKSVSTTSRPNTQFWRVCNCPRHQGCCNGYHVADATILEDQNTPSKGAEDSTESGDDEHVLKQLSIGSKDINATAAKQTPATDSDWVLTCVL